MTNPTDEGFQPTPGEQAMMDQNMAHARTAARRVVDGTAALIEAGERDAALVDAVLDLVLAASRPRDWPGRRITREIAVVAMLIQVAIEAAAGTTPR